METLDLGDFILFELLRLRKIDQGLLEEIVVAFGDLDQLDSGVLLKPELVKQGTLLPTGNTTNSSQQNERNSSDIDIYT